MKEIISSEHELKSDVFKNEAFLWPYLVEVRDKMRVGGRRYKLFLTVQKLT